MCLDLIIHRELERLRSQEQQLEPLVLHLPKPMPYWPEIDREEPEEESSHGVVIIDMNDYTIVETD